MKFNLVRSERPPVLGVRHFCVALLMLGTLLGCGERKAIETVQKAKVGAGLFSRTWKEDVEHRPMEDSTAQDWTWSADRSRSGLEPGEWFVRYVDKSGSGYFWIARPDTGAVIFLNDDRLASFRVGSFDEHSENIKVTISEQGFFTCGTAEAKAFCYRVVGTATNVNQPLVKAETSLGLVVKVGDRTEKGRNWFRIEKPLPTVSEQKPWEKGASFSFDYWSKAIPEVFARQNGEALVFLEMNTSSLTWADVTTPVFVSKLNWPPKSTGKGAIPQVPPMEPPDFTVAPEYKFDISQSENICRDKWTKRGELDRQMFAYCVGREREGYAELVVTLKKFRKHDWIASTFPTIWAKWTNGGNTLYSQVAFNLKNEGEAYLDYQYASKELAFDSAKMAGCESEWADHSSRWAMTMHCYKN